MLLIDRRRYMHSANDVIMTSATNPEVLAICYAQGWCASADKMTKAEAEQVSSLGTAFRSSNIVHFDELQYFTALTEIYDRAFMLASSLVSVTLPPQITRIGIYAFFQTPTTLTELPSGVTEIGNYAFQNCPSLALTALPSGLTSLGVSVFSNCIALQVTEIPNGISVIPQSCFATCTTIPSMHLHSGVTEIQDQGLNRLYKMATLRCDATTAPTLGSNVFVNCGIQVSGDKQLIVPSGATGYDQGDWQTLQTTYGYTLIYE